jgi:hypothetical protein
MDDDEIKDNMMVSTDTPAYIKALFFEKREWKKFYELA